MPRYALTLTTLLAVLAVHAEQKAPFGPQTPMLVRSSLAPASTVFVREFPGRNDELIEQLAEVCEAAGVDLHVVPAGEPYAYNHIWMQDTVEFLELADGSGTVALAANRNRELDRFVKNDLLSDRLYWLRVGEYREAFAKGEGGDSWIDWYGNLEASPPTEDWPNGRVLYGVNPDTDAQMHPDVVNFFKMHGLQEPLALDVGWLTIKHVDEMVSFLPAEDGGFYVAVPDPTAALSLLKKLRDDGHGDAPMLDVFEEGVTVASLLDDADFVAANKRLAKERIAPMAKALLTGIGVERDRLRRLPVLFNAGGTPRTPNVVNCLVLPGEEGARGHVAMADPNGPVIDGEDAFQAETRRRLEGVNAELHFVDDRQYHKWSGNVHCATNAIRPLP